MNLFHVYPIAFAQDKRKDRYPTPIQNAISEFRLKLKIYIRLW
jgi:hypothetical protein